MTAILYPLNTRLSVTMVKGEVPFEHKAANLLCSQVTKCASLGGGEGREGQVGLGRGERGGEGKGEEGKVGKREEGEGEERDEVGKAERGREGRERHRWRELDMENRSRIQN